MPPRRFLLGGALLPHLHRGARQAHTTHRRLPSWRDAAQTRADDRDSSAQGSGREADQRSAARARTRAWDICPGRTGVLCRRRCVASTPSHRLALRRVIEVISRARSPLVVSHFAAAAVWGIDLIGRWWPEAVDILVPRAGGGRSSGSFRRRTTTFGDVATVDWRGHAMTTPAPTALDLSRVGSFTQGVVAIDQARWERRSGGALATRLELERLAEADPRQRGRARICAALEFSSDLSDSVREMRCSSPRRTAATSSDDW